MRPNGKEALGRIDTEVVKARRDILASGDNVSAWKVSQAVCLALKVDSESLGFQMQQVPSLHDLIVTEGKTNAFIHCFVVVRRITILHDLELAICENEGKEVKIEELLDFIAENRSLTGREKLNVRFQNLGRHIAVIQKAAQSEDITMMKHVDGLKEKFGVKFRKRPILSSQKKKLDDRFNHISERVKDIFRIKYKVLWEAHKDLLQVQRKMIAVALTMLQ